MRNFKASNGVDHVVSDQHAALIDAGFDQDWPDAEKAETIRLNILEKSNERALTPLERKRLEAATHIKNLHSSAAWLQDRMPDEFFGADGTLCQVHGQRRHMECGCVLHEAFDHHKRNATGAKQIYPHYPHSSCEGHAHLAHDFEAHHARVHADHKK